MARPAETPLDWIDRRRDELLRFAAALVAKPSPNPPGDERAVVRVILAEMDRLGLALVREIIAKFDAYRRALSLAPTERG